MMLGAVGHYVDYGNLHAAVNKLIRPRLQKFGEAEVLRIKRDIGIRCPAYANKDKRNHSPPGDPPYLEKAKLQFSVKYRIVNHGEPLDVLELRAQRWNDERTDPKIAIYLEEGTKRMAARPFMRPSLTRVAAGAVQALKDK